MTPKLKQEVEAAAKEYENQVFIGNETHCVNLFKSGAQFMYDYLLKNGPEFYEDHKLNKEIQKECEAWSCWKDLSEAEQDDVFDGYLKISKFQHQQDSAFISARDEKIKGLAFSHERLRYLEQENKDLKYLLDSINKHVIPGELDSSEAATEIIKKQREEIARFEMILDHTVNGKDTCMCPYCIQHRRLNALEKKLEIAVTYFKQFKKPLTRQDITVGELDKFIIERATEVLQRIEGEK